MAKCDHLTAAGDASKFSVEHDTNDDVVVCALLREFQKIFPHLGIVDINCPDTTMTNPEMLGETSCKVKAVLDGIEAL